MLTTIEVDGRVFTYVGPNWKWDGYSEYVTKFIPKGRKTEISARLETDRSGRVTTIVTHAGYGRERINYRVRSPSGLEFGFGGTFAGFMHLFGVGRNDIKRSSRTRKPLANGWQFWRVNHVIFIP